MSDIFDRMTKSYIKSASLTQPLRTRRDYGTREAADFLADDLMADSTVQINTGYTQGLRDKGPRNANTTTESLISDLFISRQTLYNILRRHRIDSSRPAWSPPRALTPDQELELIRRYQEEPNTKVEILASQFSISTNTMNDILKRHGIKRSRASGPRSKG